MSDSEKQTPIKDWPDARQFRRSIRMEFSIYVSVAVLILMGVTGYIITDKYVKTVSDSVINGLLGQARSYASSAGKHMLLVEGPDILMLNNLCRKMTDRGADWYWAGVTGSDSIFHAHTDMQHVVTNGRMTVQAGATTSERPGESLVIRGDTIVVTVPIEENDAQLGFLVAAGSSARITEVRRSSIRTVASITAVMLLVGLPLTMVIVQRRLRPIRIITDRLKDIKVDDLSIDLPIKTRNEFGYLAATLGVLGGRLNQAQKELVIQERISRELEIAREIQANILPKEFPVDPRFEFAGVYESAREVGGDYYDFIDFGDDHLGFLVADVSGKSLPGMLVMLLTRDMVRSTARSIREPVPLMKEVNLQLKDEIKRGMFVTMFYGLLEKSTGRFQFASAGHNPLMVMRGADGSIEALNPKGFPLGMMPPPAFNQRIEAGELILSPDDWLVQYTDGVNEAHNDRDEEYGMDRFTDALRTASGLLPTQLTAACIEHLRSFVGGAPQYDDITLLTMKWYGAHADKYTVNQAEAEHAG